MCHKLTTVDIKSNSLQKSTQLHFCSIAINMHLLCSEATIVESITPYRSVGGEWNLQKLLDSLLHLKAGKWCSHVKRIFGCQD